MPMRTVGAQLIAEREGRGSVAAPSPRTPQPGSHSAAWMFFSKHHKKRDISIEVRMGTFLKSFDTVERWSLTAPPPRKYPTIFQSGASLGGEMTTRTWLKRIGACSYLLVLALVTIHFYRT